MNYVREVKLARDELASRFSKQPVLHNRYLLLNMLGRGGFSEVFRVRPGRLDGLRAVFLDGWVVLELMRGPHVLRGLGIRPQNPISAIPHSLSLSFNRPWISSRTKRSR